MGWRISSRVGSSWIYSTPVITRALIAKRRRRVGRIKVGIAGLSVGSSITRALAMTGVQHLRIADFDTIAPSNNNRLRMGSVRDVGERKATILARELYEFNPYIDLQVFHAGVTDANVDAFLDGLDVLVDHIDDLPCKLRLRAEAARRGVIVLMGTDRRGTLLLGFDPHAHVRRNTTERVRS